MLAHGTELTLAPWDQPIAWRSIEVHNAGVTRGRWGVRQAKVRPWGIAGLALVLLAALAALVGGSSSRGPLTRFDEGGLAFDYPTEWRVHHYQMDSSFSHLIAYLGTVDVPAPCITTYRGDSTEIACADRYTLSPDSLVAAVSSNGFPTFTIRNVPAGATTLVVDGLPAYLEQEPAGKVNETETLTWTLALPESVDNYYTIRASIRGPHLARFEGELQALVGSLRYDPPVVPLPSASGAAEAAAAKALGIFAKDSPTWACFPAPGQTRHVEISALTSGPTLAQPQVATCTTTIEATALQLWRMTLTLRLPEVDPLAGGGELLTVWINPDGTPGTTEGGPLP